MTNTAPILEVHDLVKDFGGVRAVDHCSLRIKRGAITGIIGPNGAGKTTLFNLVSGAMSPTSGQVIFDGRRIDKDGNAPDFLYRGNQSWVCSCVGLLDDLGYLPQGAAESEVLFTLMAERYATTTQKVQRGC